MGRAMKFAHLDTKDIETTESYFFDRFLGARIDSGMESNEGYDLILELGLVENFNRLFECADFLFLKSVLRQLSRVGDSTGDYGIFNVPLASRQDQNKT